MQWFDILHALLVILIVSQISVGLSNEEVGENTTLDPVTIDPTFQNDSADDEQKITRRSEFRRPPASAYQPTKHKKQKQVIQELPVPLAPPPQPPQLVPQYAAAYPVAPVAPMAPMPMAPSRPMRPRPRPRPRPIPSQPPAPSIGDFLPSAISGLTNMLTGGGGPPSGGTPNGPLGPLGNLLGPLSGLIKPALSLLGPLAKTLAGALPFGKTLLDLFETIKKLLSFFTDFNLSKFVKCIKRIIKAICAIFSCVPQFIDKLCRLLGKLFQLIPKTFMLIPRLINCLHKMPERIERCIELLYRFCKTIEKFLAFIKQAIWNMLRLLGNTVLMPLRIIAKTIAEVIYLPIKLLAEPFFAFTELLRAILYPFRKLYHFLLSRLDYIVEELYYLVKWLFGSSPSKVHTVVVNHSPIPLIRVYPKLSMEPSTSLASYILAKR